MSSRKKYQSVGHGEDHSLKDFHHYVGRSRITRRLAARVARYSAKRDLRRFDQKAA